MATPDPSPYEIGFRDSFWFPATPNDLWADLTRTDLYPRWWRWMRAIEVEGDWPRAGSALSFRVVAPIPYPMRLRTEVVRADEPTVLEVRVTGSLQGRGGLRFAAEAPGTRATVTWNVEIASARLRPVIHLARPVLVRAQHWAVRVALRGFRAHLERSRPSPD